MSFALANNEDIMKKIFCAAGFVFLLLQAPAHAQSMRTWVMGTGDDANPCTRTAPCKSFAGAISKTQAGGVIGVVDPGGYGSVNINKSISIISEGAQASVLTAGTNGIVINAGAGDVVNLEGLLIQAGQPGGNGIEIAGAGTVRVSHCLVSGYQNGAGINLNSSAATKVFVSECEIAQNSNGVSASQGNSEVVLDRVRLVGNQTAILGTNNGTIFHLNNSVLAYNGVAIGKVDGKILSSQTNALTGNGSDGQAMTAEALK
jgi:hypothetical protein